MAFYTLQFPKPIDIEQKLVYKDLFFTNLYWLWKLFLFSLFIIMVFITCESFYPRRSKEVSYNIHLSIKQNLRKNNVKILVFFQ